MDFLQKPYYPLPEPQVYADTSIKGWPPALTTKALTIECYLQSELYSTMSNIEGYLNPNYNTFLSARTAQAIMDNYVWEALNRSQWYPTLAEGIDPFSLGMKYGKLQISLMQQINSGDGVTSLWDAWVKMTEPVK
jgi:hypothetical protein